MTVEGNFGLTEGVAWWMNAANILFWCAEELNQGNYYAVRVDVGGRERGVDCSVYVDEQLPRSVSRAGTGYVHSGTYTMVNPAEKGRLLACLQRSNPDMERVGITAPPPHVTGGKTAAKGKLSSQEWPAVSSASPPGRSPARTGPRRRLFESAQVIQPQAPDDDESSLPTTEELPALSPPKDRTIDRAADTLRLRDAKNPASSPTRPAGRRRRRDMRESLPVAPATTGDTLSDAVPLHEAPTEKLEPPAEEQRAPPGASQSIEQVPTASQSIEQPAAAAAAAADRDQPPLLKPELRSTFVGRSRTSTRRVRVTRKTDQMNPWLACSEGSPPPVVTAQIQTGDPPMLLVPCDDQQTLESSVKVRKSRLWIAITPLRDLEPGTRVQIFLRLPDATFIQFDGRVSDQDPIRTVLAADFLDDAKLGSLLAVMQGI
jgi:hypothetical protein